ncbi:MAG: hypothetical protein KQI81_14130 [Deltaproteobacteria bacterium]|nr:hypothetical protein [Deltaproteobacteria bacterium]
MDPDLDVAFQVRQFIERSMIIGPEPVPEVTEPPDRKKGIRHKIAFYTAIAAVSMAVFFYGALRLAVHIHSPDGRSTETAVKAAPVETLPVFMPAVLKDPQILHSGKITDPLPHAITDRTVTISGYTANLPVDTPFVWLIVDVPSIGRCWPKRPMIQPNGTFQATIFEGGPNLGYTVSLYAVGYGLNKIIEQWLAAGTFGGLPMVPQQYRLDSVRLSLNGV